MKNLEGFFLPRGNSVNLLSVFKNLSKVRIRHPHFNYVNGCFSMFTFLAGFSRSISQSSLYYLTSDVNHWPLNVLLLKQLMLNFHVTTGNACKGTQRTACIRLVAKYMHKDVPNIKLLKNSLFFPSTRKVAFCLPVFSKAFNKRLYLTELRKQAFCWFSVVAPMLMLLLVC